MKLDTIMIAINEYVERRGSAKDYTTGRKGIVIEINGDRCRVRWVKEKDGSLITTMAGIGVRTWVNRKFLISMTSDRLYEYFLKDEGEKWRQWLLLKERDSFLFKR